MGNRARVPHRAGQGAAEKHGTESVRSINGLWIVAEGKRTVMDKPTIGSGFQQRGTIAVH